MQYWLSKQQKEDIEVSCPRIDESLHLSNEATSKLIPTHWIHWARRGMLGRRYGQVWKWTLTTYGLLRPRRSLHGCRKVETSYLKKFNQESCTSRTIAAWTLDRQSTPHTPYSQTWPHFQYFDIVGFRTWPGWTRVHNCKLDISWLYQRIFGSWKETHGSCQSRPLSSKVRLNICN